MGTTPVMRAQGIEATRRRGLTRAFGPERTRALRDSMLVLVASRVTVALVAVVAAEAWTGSGFALHLDEPTLTQPFGGALGTLLSSMSHWDAVWYLRIANHGYSAGPTTAFFPLYPLLSWLLAWPGSGPGAVLVAGYVLSIASFGGALYLLHRLVTLELGPQYARPTLALLAFSPVSLWFGAPYSESLFLLLSVGAFYAARIDRFALAGLAAAGASATRNAGVLLLVPLAIMWWRGSRRPRDLGWIALAPAGLIAYSLYLNGKVGDPFAYTHLSKVWFRAFEGPFSALGTGAVAAFDGVRQLASGSRAHVYFTAAGGDPFAVAGHNLEEFAFALVALALAGGVLRRLPLQYGAYTVALLLLDLSFPSTPEPLMSFSRYAAVIFPLFMWLALWCRSALRLRLVLALSVLVLGVLTARYASWHWVA